MDKRATLRQGHANLDAMASIHVQILNIQRAIILVQADICADALRLPALPDTTAKQKH